MGKKKSPLAWLAEERRADVQLHGTRSAERFDDAALEVLGSWPITKATLQRQHITKVPPFDPALSSLWIRDCFSIAALDGIERLTSLQTLKLEHLPALASIAGIDRALALQSLELSELPLLDLDATCELLAELPELTSLQLDRVSQLPASIAKLPSLVRLTVAFGASADLRKAFEIIGSIPTLRSLRIANVSTIPDALEPLARIERLSTSGAGEVFPPSVGALANLTALHLEGSSFRALPRSIGKLSKLCVLSIKNTPIAALPDELFECAALESIDASNSLLAAVPERISRLTKLRALNVATLKLKSLPRSIGQLAELRELVLPFDSKLHIPDEIFDLRLERFVGDFEIQTKLTMRPAPTPHADLVRLYDKERLPADFGDPVQLELLIGEHPDPLPQLSKMPRLQVLKIDTGDLDDAFTRLATAPHLKSIEIFGMHRALPDSIGKLAQIERLSIDAGKWGYSARDSVLSTLPDAIGALAHLKHLTIKRNAISRLPDAIGRLGSLEELVLHTCEMAELPDVIGTLGTLASLTLFDASKLQRLPASFAGCASLATFVLDGGFGFFEHVIGNIDVIATAPALKSLVIQKVNLPALDSALDGMLAKLTTLERLDLTNSSVTTLPASVGRLRKLHTLQLDGTGISTLPPELRACSELREVVLRRGFEGDVKACLPPGKWKTTKRTPSWYTRSA